MRLADFSVQVRTCLAVILCLLAHGLACGQVTAPDTTVTDTTRLLEVKGDTIPKGKGKGAFKGGALPDTTARTRSIVERQTDPVGIDKDSLRAMRKLEFRMSRDPKSAVRRSLLIPGWGQVYNHKYWKVPIIYAGFGAIGYFIYTNNEQFQIYKQAVKCRAYGTCPDEFPDDSEETLISNREYYRRFRDLNVIFAALWYTLQAVDAYVDGHMAGFDVSDDLGFRVSPNLQFDPMRKNVVSGLTLNFNLNK